MSDMPFAPRKWNFELKKSTIGSVNYKWRGKVAAGQTWTCCFRSLLLCFRLNASKTKSARPSMHIEVLKRCRGIPSCLHGSFACKCFQFAPFALRLHLFFTFNVDLKSNAVFESPNSFWNATSKNICSSTGFFQLELDFCLSPKSCRRACLKG